MTQFEVGKIYHVKYNCRKLTYTFVHQPFLVLKNFGKKSPNNKNSCCSSYGGFVFNLEEKENLYEIYMISKNEKVNVWFNESYYTELH